MKQCPKCGSEDVGMYPAYGGRPGTGETMAYTGQCHNCGHTVKELPSNMSGKKRDAIAEWDKLARGRNYHE
jgi:C4-type Zn-finger protein